MADETLRRYQDQGGDLSHLTEELPNDQGCPWFHHGGDLYNEDHCTCPSTGFEAEQEARAAALPPFDPANPHA